MKTSIETITILEKEPEGQIDVLSSIVHDSLVENTPEENLSDVSNLVAAVDDYYVNLFNLTPTNYDFVTKDSFPPGYIEDLGALADELPLQQIFFELFATDVIKRVLLDRGIDLDKLFLSSSHPSEDYTPLDYQRSLSEYSAHLKSQFNQGTIGRGTYKNRGELLKQTHLLTHRAALIGPTANTRDLAVPLIFKRLKELFSDN